MNLKRLIGHSWTRYIVAIVLIAFASALRIWPQQELAELEPLLAVSSMQANRVFEKHAALLKAELGSLGSELERQIGHFLYPEALDILKRVSEKYPELGAQ